MRGQMDNNLKDNSDWPSQAFLEKGDEHGQ